MIKLFKYKRRQLESKTGIELYPGVAEIGVKVNHGKTVISRSARLGRDTVILSDTTIGGEGGLHDSGAPILGERVFISSGARIIGKITICSDVVIAANAVVVKDITEPEPYGGRTGKKNKYYR